jgi:hypothetical protein
MAPRKDYECASGRGRYASDHKTRANQCKPKKKIYVRKSDQEGYVRKVRSDKGSQRANYTCVGGRGRYADGHNRAGQCKPRKRPYVRKTPHPNVTVRRGKKKSRNK